MSDFQRLWNRNEIGLSSEAQPNLCVYAQQFRGWADALCQNVVREPDIVTLNQAKVLLVDRFFEWRAVVPKRHRSIAGSGSGHLCVFQVFEYIYGQLRALELTLTPPLLFLPPPSAHPHPPPPPQIAGIFLGEIDEEHHG